MSAACTRCLDLVPRFSADALDASRLALLKRESLVAWCEADASLLHPSERADRTGQREAVLAAVPPDARTACVLCEHALVADGLDVALVPTAVLETAVEKGARIGVGALRPCRVSEDSVHIVTADAADELQRVMAPSLDLV